jgi:hypothetical protein
VSSHSELIEDLAEMFSAGGAMSDRKAELYLDALSAIPADHLAVVVGRIINTRQSAFMPMPGEIKDAYTDLMLGPPMPSEALDWCMTKHREQEAAFDRAYFAKPVLERGARGNYHPKAPTEYPDMVTQEAVRLCDWAELVEMDRDYRKGYWDKKYATARELVAKRLQAGEVRLSLPQPENVRQIKAVS